MRLFIPRLAWLLLLPLLPQPAQAQTWAGLWDGASPTPGATGSTECPKARTFDPIDPTAEDTFGVIFEGRSLASVDSYGAELISGTDSTPAAIFDGAPTASGGTVQIALDPNDGCAAPGCREGNWYEIMIRPVDASGNKPVARFCLPVRRARYARPSGE